MNPIEPRQVPAHAWSSLVSYLQESGSNAYPEDIVSLAIEDWIAHERRRAAAPGRDGSVTGGAGGAGDPGRGYQWKSLFLPSGTRLRMWYGNKFHYAEVDGDDIVFQGRAISPAQMANAVAGSTRNAWRDIALLLPGESSWKVAALRRRQARQLEERLALGPPAPMPAAPAPKAESDEVSKPLRQLANLIEKALVMRQVAPFRRHTDVLGDSPAFD